MKLKANILDEKAIKRSLIRISHEIIEKNKGIEEEHLFNAMDMAIIFIVGVFSYFLGCSYCLSF